MMLRFVTTNAGKFEEAKLIFSSFGFSLERIARRYVEIQADNLEDVAKASAEHLIPHVQQPFMIEDAGIFVEALSGFPGVYSSYVYRTIGLNGVLALLAKHKNRNAQFISVCALVWKGKVHMFVGKCKGTIANQARGHYGFGFDPIFIPEGDIRTFAEMKTEEKNKYSHRGKSMAQVAKFIAAELNQ